MLKLIRVTRLSRIIAKMNFKEETKLSLKLFQLIFFITLYLHCLGCIWFLIVDLDQTWIPPLTSQIADQFFYDDSIFRQYIISVYHAVLLLTGNDITPVGDYQIAFVALSISFGAIVNANIFGNMALILSALNRKTSEFQSQIDTANTAMKNMKLPHDLQRKVLNYLQYT